MFVNTTIIYMVTILPNLNMTNAFLKARNIVLSYDN